MKNSTKTSLFGGALMAAGLSAQAQTFIYADTDTSGTYSSFAYSAAYGGYVDVAYRPAALDTLSYGYSAYFGGTTMSTSQTAGEMRSEAQWDGYGLLGYGYGTNVMQQYFQVSADATLLIEWDVSGTDGYTGLGVFEDVSGSTVFAWSPLAGDSLTGSALVAVQAGVDYGLVFGMQDIFSSGFGPYIYTSTDTQFISVTVVPTPGAAGVLGLGGLLAARRRRG